jgi:transposase
MRHLSEVQVARAVALIQHGHSFRHVSRDLRVSPSVIQRLWNRFRETGQYVRRTGQGRNRKTTQNQDRFLVLSSLPKRTATARDLLNDLRRAHGIEISDQTVRNRLKEANLKPRRPVRAPRLTQHHKAARMRFALGHRDWQLRHWTPVLFIDESRFRLTRCDGRVRVYRRPGERYTAATAVQEVDRFGRGCVIVWAGISIDNRTDLVVVPGRLNAMNYIENILEDHVVPAAYGVGQNFILMQDNAKPHTAGITRNFLQERGMT